MLACVSYFLELSSWKTGTSPLSLVKLDVAALERDMPKYQDNIPKAAFHTWKQWLERVKSATSVPDECEWAIDTLKLAARSEPVPLAEQRPEELLELRNDTYILHLLNPFSPES